MEANCLAGVTRECVQLLPASLHPKCFYSLCWTAKLCAEHSKRLFSCTFMFFRNLSSRAQVLPCTTHHIYLFQLWGGGGKGKDSFPQCTQENPSSPQICTIQNMEDRIRHCGLLPRKWWSFTPSHGHMDFRSWNAACAARWAKISFASWKRKGMNKNEMESLGHEQFSDSGILLCLSF